MILKNEFVIKSNSKLDVNFLENARNAISVNGEIKILYCEQNLLDEVLGLLEAGLTWKAIKEKYVPLYGIEMVEKFFSTLINEKVLKIENKEEVFQLEKILIIGEGKIKENVIKQLVSEKIEYAECKMEEAFNVLQNVKQNEFFKTVVLPNRNTYKEILDINHMLVQKEMSYLLLYYNGENIVIGPHVYPWKTTCYECHVTQRLRLLNQNIADGISIEELEKLIVSYEINDDFRLEQLQFVSTLVVDEIKISAKNNATNHYVKKEKLIAPNEYGFKSEKVYQPISDCRCCHGMNKNVRKFSASLVPKGCMIKQGGNNIQYRMGGFRSIDADETEKMVHNALENAGLNVDITLVEDNPFADVLPVYDSAIQETHKNNTPYFFVDQLSHGKGINKKQAYFSAVFELFERISARYYGEKEIIRASINDIGDYAINFESLINQIHNENTTYEKFNREMDIDWVWGESLLTGEPKLVPASMAFLTSSVFKGKFFNDTSSGLAAGGTIKDAILQGLLELVEHDAWLIGQCNPIRLPILRTNNIKNNELKKVMQDIRDAGYQIISRDYTNDIGIPVVRSWISNPNNYTVYAASGVGASISPEMALERSITEAVQAAIPTPYVETTRFECTNMRDLIESRDSLYGLYYFQQKDIEPAGRIKDISEYEERTYKTVDEMLEHVIKRIKCAIPNCDIVFVNLTREVFGIPVVRVIITGDIQRLSMPLITVSKRLYEFQKNMGYSQNIPKYEELYMGPYPH